MGAVPSRGDGPSEASLVKAVAPLWFRSALTTILFPGMVAGVIPWWIARRSPAAAASFSLAWWFGSVILVGGIAVLLQTIWDFGALGRGTLAPWDAPERLVRGRIYRWVRNPMYLGVLSVIAGQALLWQATGVAWYFLLMAVVFHIRVVAFEEPVLQRQFGEPYADYLNTVPRWIPRAPRTELP